jgi:hypothetical protein
VITVIKHTSLINYSSKKFYRTGQAYIKLSPN